MGFAKPIEQIFIKLSRYIYVSKRYYTRRIDVANDKIICKCYKVTEKDIKKAIKKGAESAKDIRKETKADTACRHCTKKFEKTVKDLLK